MKTRKLMWMLASLAVLIALPCQGGEVRISEEELLDKIKGGWLGQIIGVVVGGPTEFRAQARTYADPLNWNAAEVKDCIGQDDLYVEMTFAKVMDDIGLDASMLDYGKAFGESQYHLWHANFMGRQNIRNGIMPPDSGSPEYNAHADDIDFQIEADFIGLMCPGLPQTSNRFCDRVGHVMNYGDGVYGGVFVAAMYADAFYENDPRALVEAGLAALPAESGYAKAIRDVLDWSKESPDDWKAVWQRFETRWANTDSCPQGALDNFDIDAKTNGAYIAIGLLYGEGDLKKTIEISTRCGQDSDCNPASAAGVLGVALGFKAMPDDWVAELKKIENEKFAFTDYSFNDICRSTLERAKTIIAEAGGKKAGGEWIYETQTAEPAPLEQWIQEQPIDSIGADASMFEYTGAWDTNRGVRASAEKGAKAKLTFTGTGAMICGTYFEKAGDVKVYLDGNFVRTAALFTPDANRGGESIYHVFGLPRGEHTIELVNAGPDKRGGEGVTAIQRAVVFDGPEKPRNENGNQ
ncbi:MAG: ADP-ribosylglycohydrolase family protein [bacterium]|nr:ADP-ribosylglycohydrolase family protein [bacterium]